MNKIFKLIIVISIAIIIVATMIYLGNDDSKYQFNHPINFEKFASFGTFISSIVGIVIGITTIYLIYKTYKSQKEEFVNTVTELKETKINSIRQTKTLAVQQFENTFFKLIENHRKKINGFPLATTSYALLENYASDIQMRFNAYAHSVFNKEFVTIDAINNTPFNAPFVRSEFYYPITKNISTIIDFIEGAEFLAPNEKIFYHNLLCDDLWTSELKLFAAYILFEKGSEYYLKLKKVNSGNYFDEFNKWVGVFDLDKLTMPSLFISIQHGSIEDVLRYISVEDFAKGKTHLKIQYLSDLTNGQYQFKDFKLYRNRVIHNLNQVLVEDGLTLDISHIINFGAHPLINLFENVDHAIHVSINDKLKELNALENFLFSFTLDIGTSKFQFAIPFALKYFESEKSKLQFQLL